jgi:hypothetical protein
VKIFKIKKATLAAFGYPGRELNPHEHCCPQDFKSCVSTSSTTRVNSEDKKRREIITPYGAEDEARTRDLNLGKVALYQLSYFRLY